MVEDKGGTNRGLQTVQGSFSFPSEKKKKEKPYKREKENASVRKGKEHSKTSQEKIKGQRQHLNALSVTNTLLCRHEWDREERKVRPSREEPADQLNVQASPGLGATSKKIEQLPSRVHPERLRKGGQPKTRQRKGTVPRKSA